MSYRDDIDDLVDEYWLNMTDHLRDGEYIDQSDPLRYAQRDKNRAIPTHHILPSYTEHDFSQPQTVYLAEGHKLDKATGYVKKAAYNYNDGLVQWYGFEKHLAAHAAVDKTLPIWSPMNIEQYLQNVTDNPKLELVHIMAGVHSYTLSPYQVYGYLEHRDEHKKGL